MELDKALSEIVAKLSELAQQHGSEAVQLAGHVLQMKAIGKLLAVIPCALLLILASAVLVKILPRAKRAWQDLDSFAWAFGGAVAVASLVIVGFVAAIALVIAAADLFNPVIWAAAFDPRIAIAAAALKAL
jgi:hypothetical protein